MSLQRLLCVVLSAAAVSACQRNPSPTDEARDICLAAPAGGTALDEAIRKYQAQARELPTRPGQWLLVGRAWVRKARSSSDPGFFLNVRACADEALRVAPASAAALDLKALTLMNDHRFADARTMAERALAIDAKDIVAVGTLSDALLELGDFERAAALTQRMVDLRPDMASYSRAAYFRWLEGDAPHAKLFMRYALNGRDFRDPEPAAWTFVQAAAMFWNDGDYDGADAVFAEALKWVPGYPPALTGRARVALARGRGREALAYLERAMAASPLPETAWLMGDAHDLLGDAAAARDAYARVVRDGRRADRLTLALFYATKNRGIDEAMRLIEAERATRGGIYVDDVYAWVLYRAGRFAAAREASDRALRLGTRDPRLLFHAGAIRQATGDASGRDLIREALRLNPKFDLTSAAEAARILDRAVPAATH